MNEKANETSEPMSASSGILLGNAKEPIRLRDANIHGVAAEPVIADTETQADIWFRMATTSDDPVFHRVVEQFDRVISSLASKAGHSLNLKGANTVLLVLNERDEGDLWVDGAAISLNILLKRSVKAGSPIYENDIADIIGMTFPKVSINNSDRVICWFRVDWRFGLFFDFNPQGLFDHDGMVRQLGSLYRTLKYRHLYDCLKETSTFEKLLGKGWFPFAEIINDDFTKLSEFTSADLSIKGIEEDIVAKFDDARIERIFERWMRKPHFLVKEKILRSALNSFKAGDSIATIKIALTEIEGVLRSAYKSTNGESAKLPKLLEFAVTSAERKAGSGSTLLFATAFLRYLRDYTFANFDPMSEIVSSSRHAVGHGAAPAECYTQVAALQTILTLDQIAFYT